MSSSAKSAASAESPASAAGRKWLPVVSSDACTGCNACIEACGPACLELVDRVAVLVNAATCGSEEHCIVACPDDAIRMEWVAMDERDAAGQWRG